MRHRLIPAVLLALSLARPLAAQTATGAVMPSPVFTGWTSLGVICGGCKLYTYEAGTTTPLATFSDSSLTTANTNPVVLSSAGRATVFLASDSYRFDLKTSADVLVWSVDNIKSTSLLLDLDVQGTAGEDLAAGAVAYLSDGSGGKTTGRWYKADADFTYASSAALTVGMIPKFINSGALGVVRLGGHLTLPSASMVAGDAQFVSATAGALTNTAPTNLRLVGIAETPSIVFMPLASGAGGGGGGGSIVPGADLTGLPFTLGGSAAFSTVNTSYPTGATFDKLSPNTAVYHIDSAVLAGGVYKLEATLAAQSGGIVTLVLVNLTDGAPDTPIVTLTTTSTTGERLLSDAITFAAGGSAKDYGVKLKSSSGSLEAWAWGIRILRVS